MSGQSEERRMALHDLLDRPAIALQDEPEVFQRIAYHEPYLKSWFMERPQWRLLRGRGIYRLERMPSLIMSERGLPRLRSQLAYASLCWVLWFAETMATGSRDWFVISELADRVSVAAEGRFTLAERKHREAMVQALQLLTDLGALVLRDGDTDRWITSQGAVAEEIEVMYEFADSAPRLLANFAYDGLPAIMGRDPRGRQAIATGEAGLPLTRAWRALLLGPILWRADDPEAFVALEGALEQVQRDLDVALGWQLQCNRDYACLWRVTTARHAGALLLDLYPDPDVPVDERSIRYLYHPILLLLGRLQGEVAGGARTADGDGAVSIAEGELYDLLGDLRSEYRKHWGATLGSLSSDELTAQVLVEMRRMGLLRGPDGSRRFHVLPPAALIRGEYRSEASGRRVSEPAPSTSMQATFFDA